MARGYNGIFIYKVVMVINLFNKDSSMTKNWLSCMTEEWYIGRPPPDLILDFPPPLYLKSIIIVYGGFQVTRMKKYFAFEGFLNSRFMK